MNATTPQTREAIAQILGRVRADCPAVITAHRHLYGDVLLGVWRGTAKYQGPRAWARLQAAYPTASRTVQVSRGWIQGSDEFAVYGPAPLTVAQQIAGQFNDDGQCFELADGRTIHDVCREACRWPERSDVRGETRHVFSDGSVLIVGVNCWDLGLAADCWCWEGEHHHSQDCHNS